MSQEGEGVAAPAAEPNVMPDGGSKADGNKAAGGGDSSGLWGGSVLDDSEQKDAPQKQPEADAKAQPQDKPVKPDKPVKHPTGLLPLPDDADDTAKADFDMQMRALNKVPDKPEGYGDFGFSADNHDLQLDPNAEDYKHYTQAFFDAGISPNQARTLIEAHLKWNQGQIEHYKKQTQRLREESRNKTMAAMSKELGGDAAFKEFNDTATRGFLAAAKGAGVNTTQAKHIMAIMSDEPAFLKIFNNIGKNFSSDVLISGGVKAPATTSTTKAEMYAKMFKSA